MAPASEENTKPDSGLKCPNCKKELRQQDISAAFTCPHCKRKLALKRMEVFTVEAVEEPKSDDTGCLLLLIALGLLALYLIGQGLTP